MNKKNGKLFGWDDYGYRVRYIKNERNEITGKKVDRLLLTIPASSPKRPKWCPIEGDSTFFQLGDSILFVANGSRLLVNNAFMRSPYVLFFAEQKHLEIVPVDSLPTAKRTPRSTTGKTLEAILAAGMENNDLYL